MACARHAVWVAAFVLIGCRAPATPLDEARHLRVGLDARAEADAIEAQLRGRGWVRVVRVDAPDAVGLAMRGDEGRTALRVVTQRGLVLAVEAPTESLERSEVGLIDAPADLDRDGFVELLPAATDAATERRCFAIARVLPDGSLVEVTPSFEGLGGSTCLEALVDLERDGRLEVVAKVRFASLAWETAPSVALPFAPLPEAPAASRSRSIDREDGVNEDAASVADARDAEGDDTNADADDTTAARVVPGARWVLVTGARARDFFEREQAERATRLADVRRSGDVGAAFRLGVELAALARFRGADTRAQTEVLRTTADGLVLGPAAARRWADAAAFVARGWVDADHDATARDDTSDEGPDDEPHDRLPDALGDGL
ncbi:MAG: hypothetical protein MUE69_18915 [Myxococcota bacterium]|nr:hypothetical protein [Myxococcota bacterium]